MAWRVEFAQAAVRELDKLDPQAAKRVLRFLAERVALSENPRRLGQALKGSKVGDFWKYRVGDYRIIAAIEDRIVTVLVVRIGHRREVYRHP